MTDELKPIHCGCGGEAYFCSDVNEHTGVIRTYCECRKCGIRTHPQLSKENAITAWNRAMGATDTNVGGKFAKDINVPDKESVQYEW